jgi:hypothetical protein
MRVRHIEYRGFGVPVNAQCIFLTAAFPLLAFRIDSVGIEDKRCVSTSCLTVRSLARRPIVSAEPIFRCPFYTAVPISWPSFSAVPLPQNVSPMPVYINVLININAASILMFLCQHCIHAVSIRIVPVPTLYQY